MNDRFKFRVWDVDNKEYHSMDDVINNDGELGCAAWTVGFIKYRDGLHIVEQCTGLKDKNGKLIYEGDILEYFDNKIAVVYDNELPSFRLRGIDGSHYGLLSQEYVDSFGFKIIGNIHEKESK